MQVSLFPSQQAASHNNKQQIQTRMFQGVLHFNPIFLQGLLNLSSKQEIISPCIFKFWTTRTANTGWYSLPLEPRLFQLQMTNRIICLYIKLFSLPNLSCISSMKGAHKQFTSAVQCGPFKSLPYILHIYRCRDSYIYTHIYSTFLPPPQPHARNL